MNQHQERTAAVRHLVDEARRIEQNGVNYTTLEKIGGLLASLASRAELFPQDDFPLGADGGIYRLSEDPDHRFALYASAGGAGKKVPPHNHTTWAIIAGVHGAERNVVYERLDNGAQPGVVKLREAPAKESRRPPVRAMRCISTSMASAWNTCPTACRSTWRRRRPSASWPRPRS
jgi:predicted metal-dependent enzyme (double-stranded beta helix superfamily)